MRILIHDFAGHPFQIQLSRELAKRGHRVLHLHCSSYTSGKGHLSLKEGDPVTLEIQDVKLPETFEKYSGFKRYSQERRYGRLVSTAIVRWRPDVVLSANAPLFAQIRIQRSCKTAGIPFFFWQQDIYGIAMQRIAAARFGFLGEALGSYFPRLERRLLRASSGVVAITADFVPILERWGLDMARVAVIENWAPLEEISYQASTHTGWKLQQGLSDKKVFLYAGTLGLKHNPELLISLARRNANNAAFQLIVISEGIGANLIARRIDELGLVNITLLPFQPFPILSEVLSAADVLVVLLESEAGVFAVPSKVLTYLCAGRPILGAMPAENLASRIIEMNRSGLVARPDDEEAFVANARELMSNEALRQELGLNGRNYSLRTFNIASIADSFEAVLTPSTLKVL